jgi:transposase
VEHIGIDVHKNESQICLLTEQGEILESRILTRRDRLAAALGNRPRARLVIEASTESEWVARCLEELGHEVIVADPNYAPMYATRSRRVKTDQRDARTLGEACKLGADRAVHRASDAQRHVRAHLAVRDALVRPRTRDVAVIKALVRRDGLRLAQGEPERTAAKLATLALPPALAAELAPLRALLEPLNAQIETADRGLATLAVRDPQAPGGQSQPPAARLQCVPAHLQRAAPARSPCGRNPRLALDPVGPSLSRPHPAAGVPRPL